MNTLSSSPQLLRRLRLTCTMSAALFVSLVMMSACIAQNQAPPPPDHQAQVKLKLSMERGRAALKKTAAKLLSSLEYKVAFEEGTERAFRNRYWDNKIPGLYVDLISGRPLFSSIHKFRSGTGWPSFDRALDASEVIEVVDKSHGVTRTEVRSKTSDIHLGHVFEDGPNTTGRRFCINSAAVRFIPRKDLVKEGYGAWAKRAGL